MFHITRLYFYHAREFIFFFCAVVDEASKKEIKAILVNNDRSLLVADPRITEPKKFGGPGQKLVSRSLTVKTLWKIYVEGEISLWRRLSI